MKKKIFLCIVCILSTVLCSCGKEEANSLEFPGVQWGMAPAEVRESLKIQDEDIEIVEESGRGSAFVVNDYELFGAKTKYTSFQFLDFADQGEYSLWR